MHMSDQRVMKTRKLKVNCFAIFNNLDNNVNFPSRHLPAQP